MLELDGTYTLKVLGESQRVQSDHAFHGAGSVQALRGDERLRAEAARRLSGPWFPRNIPGLH